MLATDLVVMITIGPHYLDKTAAAVIDQDAGYWLLDAGRKSCSYPVKAVIPFLCPCLFVVEQYLRGFVPIGMMVLKKRNSKRIFLH